MKRFFVLLWGVAALLAAQPHLALAKTLTEKDVLQLTRTSSLTGQTLLINNDIATEEAQKAFAPYDTSLTGLFNYTSDKSARSSIIYGSESTSTNFGLGLTQLAPTGTQFNLQFDNWRQTTDSAFASADELFESQLNLDITQPLLQNFFGLATRGAIKLSQKQTAATIQKNTAGFLDLVYANVVLYWNWQYALQSQSLTSEAVRLANQLYDNNLKKKSVGLIESSDLAAFSANLNVKKSDALSAKINAEALANTLRSKLSLAETITPGVESYTPSKLPSLDDAKSLALQQNPALQAMRESLAAQNIALTLAKNAKLPRLDLAGSLALNGIDTSYAGATDDVTAPHPTWRIGASMSFPLQNRAARSDQKTAALRQKQLLYQLEDSEQTVLNDTASTYQNYLWLAEKVKVLAAAVDAQRLKWEGEIVKANQGRSDTDLILNNQNDYLQTRALHLKAKIDMRLEYAKLQWLMGRFE